MCIYIYIRVVKLYVSYVKIKFLSFLFDAVFWFLGIDVQRWLFDLLYIYTCIYIYSLIYRHVFRCTTAHQCSLEQSEWVSPITLEHAKSVTTACGTAQVTTTSRQREVRVALSLIGIHGNFKECSTTPYNNIYIYMRVYVCVYVCACACVKIQLRRAVAKIQAIYLFIW